MWPECAADPEGLALLQSAVATPADRTPRLVLADWLQEHGEEEVALALRQSFQAWGWIAFPSRVRGRWVPWDACFDGWLGVQLHPPRELASLSDSPWITALDLSETFSTDLRQLTRFANLTALHLSGADHMAWGWSDGEFQALAALKHLSTLHLFD